MAIRDTEFNPFIRGRRLFQQWLVDNYVKVERDRIEYCKNNQKKLRAETYKNLQESLQQRANARVGKIVILPSSFIGSPRNMLQNYQDAMAIVRKFGKPDLFITMTCNPKWQEIEENLLPGQSTSDRPDLVARVFNIKKEHLLHMITEEELFGKVIAWVYVIEFQKRGLPHIHLLVTLARNCKLNTAEKVDKFISAEVPTEDDFLKDTVLRNMIHSCGDWCKINNKCSKHYPMSF